MLSREENERLCRVGAGTPMGELIRRYWFPAMLSSDLPEPGGAPKGLRLLGEDLVIFREDSGRIGLLDGRCPHRRVRLTLARNEGCGLRCVYHGWMMNADGAVIDTPAEPEISRFSRNVRTVAYPVRDAGGLIWTYMGPSAECPPFPEFEWTGLPLSHLVLAQITARANFVQVLEGTIDSSHVAVLHADNVAGSSRKDIDTKTPLDERRRSVRPSTDPRPKIEVEETGYGFHYAALHRPLEGGDGRWWARVTQFVAPFYSFIPGEISTAFVPVDDYHSIFFAVSYNREAPVSAETRREREEHFGVRLGIDLDSDYTMLGRTEENNWGQDRAAMDRGDSFSGLAGVSLEDVAVQESQGRIADRSRENLGAQDIAITTMRRLLLDGAARVAATQRPLSDPKTIDYRTVRAVMGMLEPAGRWQDMDRAQPVRGR
ncbi:MAG TPA: Rieske 2Fe-2S domain-containing protein [Trebonia sp.]|jgi:phthalate 4,5-dioxygenase oxygenase subunit